MKLGRWEWEEDGGGSAGLEVDGRRHLILRNSSAVLPLFGFGCEELPLQLDCNCLRE